MLEEAGAREIVDAGSVGLDPLQIGSEFEEVLGEAGAEDHLGFADAAVELFGVALEGHGAAGLVGAHHLAGAGVDVGGVGDLDAGGDGGDGVGVGRGVRR